MNRIVPLLVLALSLPLTARADDASHRAKAQEMMTLLHTQKLVQENSDNLMKQITEAADRLAGPNPTPEKQAKVANFEKQAQQIIDSQVGWTAMQAEITDVYAKTFTDEELDSIIAFYKSPAGTALVTKMPDVDKQIEVLGGSHVQALRPKLQQLYTDFKNSLATPPPTLGPVPPAAPAAPTAPSPSTPK